MTDLLLVRAINDAFKGRLNKTHSLSLRLQGLDQIIKYVVAYISDKENLFFSSYFAKISFLSNKYNFPGKDLYLFHAFRNLFPLGENIDDTHFDLGQYVIYTLVEKCLGVNLEVGLADLDMSIFLKSTKKSEDESFRYFEKVYLKKYDIEKQLFHAVDDYNRPIELEFANNDLGEELINYLNKLQKWDRLPIKAGLFDINISGNTYSPSYYILEPDFLIDVTSVSESFDAFGVSVAGYGLRKLIDKSATLALHMGNISNVILDELIYDPSISYNYFLNSIFKISPLSFATFTNDQVRQLVEKVKEHYRNIKKVIDEDFQNLGINGRSVFVEPSYYAPRIGIQGRFDLLHQDGNEMNIIELKSGKSYRPNAYGLNNSHYHQTLLYDLILETNFGKKTKRNNFILYSAESEKALRYAPTIKAEQREAIKVRNRIYMEECRMQHSGAGEEFIKTFIEGYDGKLSGFKQQDLEELKKIYGGLMMEERKYWESCFAFLSREYSLSKIGDELSETSKGLSALWQLDTHRKKERFLLIDKLVLKEDNSQEDDPHLLFEYSEKTQKLNNFRVGDIVILYPTRALRGDRLQSQIFKCTLSVIGSDHLIVRLRSKQNNSSAFDPDTHYNIEHDVLDSSFAKTFRQLYHFAKSEPAQRQKLLGIKSPEDFNIQPLIKSQLTTESQHIIIEKSISALDYQLIWGPPGTGKTSIILKEITRHYFEHSNTRILIMGYTNRAVDEICAALQSMDEELDYIRIGSKYSCGEAYKVKLLNTKLESITNRKDLKSLLVNHQIYVGTLASILGKPEIFDLLQFGICIVDEASQILEPSLIGILSKMKKFILIGDHIQLPAIVLQKHKNAEIQDESLRKLGYRSFTESLFERLYNQAMDNRWEMAYSQLQEQGRMHEKIMNFENAHFYDHQLTLLPVNKKLTGERGWKFNSSLEEVLSNQRMIYIPTRSDEESNQHKVNRYEAKIVSELIRSLKKLLETNQETIKKNTIGIITPFRAQIALINAQLDKDGLSDMNITVDTVERYQGGAREIIIISTVVNSTFQLESIISANAKGIDRKLNVALSRAKEQIILVGNPEVLKESKFYLAYMQESFELAWKN